ncbi:MAG: discoidin domain-containing protein [Kiritimatiellae bacterium]|nr:discoidin domain-containing protein [Kiritimatiellia bacterium]MDD5522008.1 discoidin domain-containing protein [Kiritimatiellia bacterium]
MVFNRTNLFYFICLWSLTLIPCIAFDNPVTASSSLPNQYQPENVLDGNPKTRWASGAFKQHPEWLQVDFKKNVSIDKLAINWENAFALDYNIQVSDDREKWKTVRHIKGGKGGREIIEKLSAKGRYLRISCLKPGPHSLFSIWEIEFPESNLAGIIKEAIEKRNTERREMQNDAANRLVKYGAKEIILAARPIVGEHWYANFGYYAERPDKLYRDGTKLYHLDIPGKKFSVLLEDSKGGIRDPQLSYDGTKILFSYRKDGSEYYHLYEATLNRKSDAPPSLSELRELTTGPWDDIEPSYLPDGNIVFVSSRGKRWVNCWLTPVAILYRCDADGKNIRPISSNNEHDNTPWPLADGRIIYTRWEYVDRSQVHYHHLWVVNPDGTGHMTFFGNLHPGIAMLDAKPIAGSDKVIASFSPGHGQTEHMGSVTIIDPKAGPDNMSFARELTKEKDFRDPWAFSEDCIIAARNASLMLVDGKGEFVEIVKLPEEDVKAGFWLHEPRPLMTRNRETIMPSRVNLTKETGQLFLSDIYEGRNMTGVKRGEIKKILILETLPKPINYTGGMDPLSYGGTFTLERILGTVPVEEDGSAYFEAPALRSIFFVALDENDLAVKRMQSFTTVMQGETTGCVGCHEQRVKTPLAAGTNRKMAMTRQPSHIEPIKDVPDIIDFPRDIQPILNDLCVKCHDYEKTDKGGPRSGKLILSGDRGPMFSHSYYMMTIARLFSDGRNQARSNYEPRTLGSSASKILTRLDGSHHDVKASPVQKKILRLWIESGAAYPGTYAALGSGMIGGYSQNRQVNTDLEWPTTRDGAQVIDKRCVSCHNEPGRLLPKSISDERGISFWQPNIGDPRLNTSRHIVFNLSRPDKSILLLAPLSRKAGGWGLCHTSNTNEYREIFADKNDPDYQKLLAMCVAGKEHLEQIKRFDMPDFKPRPEWIREMKRYGILSKTTGSNDMINVYKVEKKYWESLWCQPQKAKQRQQGTM